MVIIKLFRRIIKNGIRFIIDSIIKRLPVYYNNLEKISLRKWFDIIEGNYIELYKIKLTKHVPSFFLEIIMDMTFKSDNVDLTELKKQADLAILYSMAARMDNKSILFQADSMSKDMEKKDKKNESKEVKLNDFIDYIEITFEQIGTIDPDKISASRAFSLYHKAVQRNKAIDLSMKRLK